MLQYREKKHQNVTKNNHYQDFFKNFLQVGMCPFVKKHKKASLTNLGIKMEYWGQDVLILLGSGKTQPVMS